MDADPDDGLQPDPRGGARSAGRFAGEPGATGDPRQRAALTGWLWGHMNTADGTWPGLTTLFPGRFLEGDQLGWHPASKLRMLA